MSELAEQVSQTTDNQVGRPKEHDKRLKYTPKIKWSELKDTINGSYPLPVAITVETVFALGALHFLNSTENLRWAGYVFTYLSASLPFGIIDRATRSLKHDPLIGWPYPDIVGKPSMISKNRFREILTDGVRGFYLHNSNLPYVYSTVDHKSDMLKAYAKHIENVEDAKVLWEVLVETTDTELKMKIINVIKSKCKPHLRSFVTSKIDRPDTTPLERAAASYLATKWGLSVSTNTDELHKSALELKRLEHKSIIKSADSVSKRILDELGDKFPKTLVPYIKLFVLRSVLQELAQNKLPNADDKSFESEIKVKLFDSLKVFDVIRVESEYCPEDVTIGMEMQPDTHKGHVYPLRTNKSDLKALVEYLGLNKSPDKPFEIVFPPTKSPAGQLLMLCEVLMLTGIPIDSAGIQISFGGIGERSTVRTLQRIVFLAGRLKPSWEDVAMGGDFWNMNDSYHKGEVDVKSLSDIATEKDVVTLNPHDQLHPEFRHVAEMRGPVGADTFFVFARGLLQASRLAKIAKASERVSNKKSVLGVEIEMSLKWNKVCTEIDKIITELGLPKISDKWSKNDWKRFSTLTTDPQIAHDFRELIKNILD